MTKTSTLTAQTKEDAVSNSATGAISKPPKGPARGADYLDALSAAQGKTRSTLTGIVIEKSTTRPFDVVGCTPIILCLCVQDSPDNPCICKGPIIWIPDGDILKRDATTRTGSLDLETQSLTRFTVRTSARVLLDRSTRVSEKGDGGRFVVVRSDDGSLEPAKGEVWVREVRAIPLQALLMIVEVLQSGQAPNSDTIALETGNPFLDAAIKAFTVGWAIGTAIDGAFDLSGKLSDWLVDNLPEWPW